MRRLLKDLLKPSMKLSIKQQLTIAFLGMAFLLIGLLWAYQAFLLEGNYVASQERWLTNQVEALAKAIDNGQTDTARQFLDSILPDGGAAVEWYGADGSLVEATQLSDLNGDGGNSWGMGGKNGMGALMRHGSLVAPKLLETQFGDQLLQQGSVLARGPFSRMQTEMLVYGRLLTGGGAVLGAMPVPAMDTAVSLLQGQLLWLAAVLLVLAVALGSVLAVTITRPVAHLEASVRRVATGDFSVRVPETGADEIASLARSVNHMSEALGKVDALKDELIANVSHELRTPLGIIRGYAEMLLDIESLTELQRRERLQHIAKEAEHLGDLVSRLLDVSQVAAGTLSLTMEPVLLSALAEDIVSSHRRLAAEADVALTLHTEVSSVDGDSAPGDATLSASEVEVMADPLRLRQVLRNLVENAIKFTPAGGHVTISVGDHHITISDTGVGIPPEHLDRIWERHYRATADFGGAGLGLSLVKSLCDAMAIQLQMTSTVGEGTQVVLTFKNL